MHKLLREDAERDHKLAQKKIEELEVKVKELEQLHPIIERLRKMDDRIKEVGEVAD